MNKQEMADQLRMRKDEIAELEGLVKKFNDSIGGKQFLMRGTMVSAYRQGIIACFDWFDRKAIALKEKRDFAAQMTNESRGISGFTPKG